MTVTELDTSVELAIGDPSEQSWTQAQRLEKLNEAQDELVNLILAKAIFNHKIYDLLTEIQESQTSISLSTTGYDISDVTSRHVLSAGIVQVECTLSSLSKYPKEISISELGQIQNSFKGGSNLNPLRYIWNNKLFILASSGSYPITTTLYYIGKAYQLALVSSGSNKSTLVSTPDINISLHHILIKMATVKLLSMRSDEKDLVEINLTNKQIDKDIIAAVGGILGKPHNESPEVGNFVREAKDAKNQ